MKKVKVFLSILMFMFVISLSVNKSEASSGMSIYIDGQWQSYSNQAIIVNGTTLVPLRGIFESLGATVNWNQTSKTIDAKRGNTSVWLKIGSRTAKINGKSIAISVSPQVRNGTTLVPLRFISESLGEQVRWDQSTRSIIVGNVLPVKRVINGGLAPDEGRILTYEPDLHEVNNGKRMTHKVQKEDNFISLSPITEEFGWGLVYIEDEDGISIWADATDWRILQYLYPIVEGQKVKSEIIYYGDETGPKYEYSDLISINSTVTVKAGTFNNVMIIKDNYGYIYYLAPGYGLIKLVDDKGNVLTELVKAR